MFTGHGKSYTPSLPGARAVAGLALALAAGCAGHSPEAARERMLREALASAAQVVVEEADGTRTRAGSGVTIARRARGTGVECFAVTSGQTFAGLPVSSLAFVVLGHHEHAPRRAEATVVALPAAGDADLALLRFESAQCAPARPARAPALGDRVWAVGFPFGGAMTLASGIVSQLNVADDAAPEHLPRLMIDAPVGYGTSGGGVYSPETGALIGLVAGFTTARVSSRDATPPWFIDVPVPGQTLVTPMSELSRFLAGHGRADLLTASGGAR